MQACECSNQQRHPGGITYFLIIKDIGELVLSITGIYVAIAWIAKRQQRCAEPLKQRRLLVFWGIALAVLLLKVSEDVIGLESGPVDKAVLTWIHARVPNAFIGFFQAITISASAKVIFPLLAIGSAVLYFV